MSAAQSRSSEPGVSRQILLFGWREAETGIEEQLRQLIGDQGADIVRTVVTAPGGQTVTDNYQFLPDTPATQANLKVTIPSGFTNDPTLDTGSSNGS